MSKYTGKTAKTILNAPDDILEMLKGEDSLFTLWKNLPPSHQREYIMWVEGAKKIETRVKRIGQMRK